MQNPVENTSFFKFLSDINLNPIARQGADDQYLVDIRLTTGEDARLHLVWDGNSLTEDTCVVSLVIRRHDGIWVRRVARTKVHTLVDGLIEDLVADMNKHYEFYADNQLAKE